MTKLITADTPETEAAGAAFARLLLEKFPGGMFTAMYGGLGAGKTAFVRGAASVLAPGAYVQSPTYTIVNEYRPRTGAGRTVFHFDLYRTETEDDLESVGFFDYLTQGAYLFAEWCEKIPYRDILPEEICTVTVSRTADGGGREIRITLPGEPDDRERNIQLQ